MRFADGSVDMGTGYDCFDTLSAALDPRVQGGARENRLLLKTFLETAGFTHDATEWWHDTLADEPFADRYVDFPVSWRALDRHRDGRGVTPLGVARRPGTGD